MLYYTGQRPISILRLQAKDIQGNAIDVAPVKKQDRHRIPISEHLMDDLMAWVKKLNPNDYLFHSENTPSKPINRFTMIEQGKPLFDHYNQGLDFKTDRKHWVSFYTMRHSAATNILAATGSEKYAGELLNHSDPKMTKRYAKVLKDKMQGAVDGL
jgi:integrase